MDNTHNQTLGGIVAEGPDSLDFLQGQLSNDLMALEPRQAQLNSLSNAKGRVLAVMAAVKLGPEHVLLVLPKSLEDDIKNHLQRYVFRAKVSLTGYDKSAMTVSLEGTAIPNNIVNVTPQVGLDLDGTSPLENSDPWVTAGLPWVYPPTQGLFVAQMLNLDLLSGINWDKGCYTGQEIIARTHYLGKNKRRMLAFTSDAPARPGDFIVDHQGRQVAIIVHGSPDPSADKKDRHRLFGVARLGQLNAALELTDGTTVAQAEMPYQIPELVA